MRPASRGDHTPEADARERDTLVAAVTAILHARGERMTGPRRAVLARLADGHGHRSAEEVVAAVARAAPDVHRASVYRALDALVDIGVVQHIHLGHGATAYHLVDSLGHHLHLQCHDCGAVVDVSADLLDDVARRLRDEHGFELDAGHVALSGRCVHCRG